MTPKPTPFEFKLYKNLDQILILICFMVNQKATKPKAQRQEQATF